MRFASAPPWHWVAMREAVVLARGQRPAVNNAQLDPCPQLPWSLSILTQHTHALVSKTSSDGEGATGGDGDSPGTIELPLANVRFTRLADECTCADAADLDATAAVLGSHEPVRMSWHECYATRSDKMIIA